jgi:hypothetical protein
VLEDLSLSQAVTLSSTEGSSTIQVCDIIFPRVGNWHPHCSLYLRIAVTSVGLIILGLLFCSYKFTVGATIADLSGLIKNIQIRAPRNITPLGSSAS